MDATYKPLLTKEFEKALQVLRTNSFSKLTQKQAEAVVAVFASRETPGEGNAFGWSFASEMDDLTRVLPFLVGAFNTIDRDCDEVVSREEFDFWLHVPRVEHRTEVGQWDAAELAEIEAGLPVYCKRGLDGPDGLVKTMQRVRALHFEEGGRETMSLRDFVHQSMKAIVEAKRVSEGAQ
mmetsp:Transcript_25387/g.73276  ORF Transcript_25387/g.73276 Transcript_25387/m.73276 type:complete len:179 (-) Transcript_25387:52-588(-)